MTPVASDYVEYWQRLMRMVAADPALTDPHLAAARAAQEGLDGPHIRTLLRCTDARPVNGVITSADGPFAYVAAAVANQQGTTSADWLHQRFVIRVLRLWREAPRLAAAMRELADSPAYWTEINALAGWAERLHGRGDIENRPLLARNEDPDALVDGVMWRSKIGGSPVWPKSRWNTSESTSPTFRRPCQSCRSTTTTRSPIARRPRISSSMRPWTPT